MDKIKKKWRVSNEEIVMIKKAINNKLSGKYLLEFESKLEKNLK